MKKELEFYRFERFLNYFLIVEHFIVLTNLVT